MVELRRYFFFFFFLKIWVGRTMVNGEKKGDSLKKKYGNIDHGRFFTGKKKKKKKNLGQR